MEDSADIVVVVSTLEGVPDDILELDGVVLDAAE